ncbi:DUF6879 family protein [Streptacidiphilus rugosus]|uniref:DUF6879 family protein n=1 Tax=Streptacidiphilus rugosus TaxID=405783 RepID=UPI0005629009|nr:DUF6879 family protein [Streptacidiphilus rugosus]
MGGLLELRALLDRARGLRLDPETYLADFEDRFWRIGPEGFWKLESLQDYQESGCTSWEAFQGGDWEKSLSLIRESQPDIERQLAKLAAAGIGHRRARVVAEPLSPYVQWELHVLHAKDRCGENVSVLTDDQAAALVGAGPLPDLVVLGDEAVYQIHYTPGGAPDGATRYFEAEAVRSARDFVRRLHHIGEPLQTYFPRAIAGLPAPRP